MSSLLRSSRSARTPPTGVPTAIEEMLVKTSKPTPPAEPVRSYISFIRAMLRVARPKAFRPQPIHKGTKLRLASTDRAARQRSFREAATTLMSAPISMRGGLGQVTCEERQACPLTTPAGA
jgi:hypothetical protein